MASDGHSTLFLTADAPFDGGSGGQIVSWRLIEAYAELGPVDVVALVPEELEPAVALQDLVREATFVPVRGFHAARSRSWAALRLGRSLIRRVPYRIDKFASRSFAEEVCGARHRNHHTLVHCDHLALSQYRRLCSDLPAILCEHNVEWQIFDRLAALAANPLSRRILQADSQRTKRWELDAATEFERVLCLSNYDREQLIAERPDLRPRVVCWPVPVTDRPAYRPSEERAHLRVLILGSLRSPARLHGTRWFIRMVWHEVRERMPEAELDIVGADPPQDLRQLDGASGIRVWGYCQNLEPVLREASLCAIPLFAGAGIRVKVLELISRGIPCVGTSVGLQGMNQIAGTVLANTVTEWLHALCFAGRELPSLREKAERGRETVRVAHSARRASGVLREQTERAIASHQASLADLGRK